MCELPTNESIYSYLEEEFKEISVAEKAALYYNALYTNAILYFFKKRLNPPTDITFEDFILLKGL